MKFRFTGKYTNDATGITILGHRFEGREPTNVTGEDAVRLSRHPEFEEAHVSDCAVHNEPAYPAGDCDCDAPVATPPKPKNKGGRPRKVVS